MTVVDPIRDERGWAFRDGPGTGAIRSTASRFLSRSLRATDPAYRGRVTVPVLWDNADAPDRQQQRRRHHAHVRNRVRRVRAAHDLDFYPETSRARSTRSTREIYESVNNGVYRAGFATRAGRLRSSRRTRVFDALDELDARLADTPLSLRPANRSKRTGGCSCTLVRFDAVYYGHFKCNLRRIVDYPNL